MTLDMDAQCVLSDKTVGHAKEAHVEPESEKFALSPHADLDELREFVRCESLERMQLCMRLQKQQELLEHLSEKALKPTVNGKAAELLAATEGAWQKQMGTEVDELKLSVENLAQDLREIQETLVPEGRESFRRPGSLVLHEGTKAQDEFVDDNLVEGELDRSFKVSSEVESVAGLHFEPALDLQWLEERLEDLQNQCAQELTAMDQRLMDEFGNLKGFVDAAIVAMVSRMSTLEIFVKGEGGISEKMDLGLQKVTEELTCSSKRLQSCQEEVTELATRLKAAEHRLERGAMVGYSPAPGFRSPELRGNTESNDSVRSSAVEKNVEVWSPTRMIGHTGHMSTPVTRATPVGSLQVPPGTGPSPWAPVWRSVGGSSPQLLSVLATPRGQSPPPARGLAEVHSAGRAPTPQRAVYRMPAPALRF